MVIFNSRKEAGEVLAERLFESKPQFQNPIVLGIPRGGIPIGHCVAKRLNAPLDTIVLRKLPIPDNPEAGFGAVTVDKSVVFNETLLSQLDLTGPEIKKIINSVYKEVLRRNKVYRQNRPFPSLENRCVVLTDDGLASGFTMLAAIRFARRNNAGEIIVAVPVAHRQAYQAVKKETDRIAVLHVSDFAYFAVASFYREFPDLSDEEVVSYLKQPKDSKN